MASLRAARPAEASLTTFELLSLPLPWRWWLLRARLGHVGEEEAPRRGRSSLRCRHRRGGGLAEAAAEARGSETCQETQKSTCLSLLLLLLPLLLLREEEESAVGAAAARRSKSTGLDTRPLTVAAAAAVPLPPPLC